MMSRTRRNKKVGGTIILCLLLLLLGAAGCAEQAYGEEGQQEISGTMSSVGAGTTSGDQQNLAAKESRTPENETAEAGQAPEESKTTSTGQTSENEAAEIGQAAETEDEKAELEIHFLDVGQGDSTLLVCGGEAMLIDAGNNDQGTRIQNYLEKQNVETLKYVICTHPDADHIGGIDVILYKFDCETVLMTDEEKDTNTYRDVIDTMETKGYKPTLPVAGARYTLGDAEFVIVGPVSQSDEGGTEADKREASGNNNSIAILVTHGENRFLFTGDAEEEEEEKMVQGNISLEADVYKAGHHGSRTSSSKTLLEAVQPSYAVISCEEGNSYGHPHAETLNNLRAMGVKLYRTDEQGSIILTSDGEEITWSCSPSENWTPGEPKGSAGGQAEETPSGNSEQVPEEPPADASVQDNVSDGTEEIRYICNINTMKFHYPDCSSVNQMKESNKLPSSSARDELISQGYEPCKRCKP